MPGIACDMDFPIFLRRFLLHFSLAALVCIGICLVLEYLIPNFVTPFIDIIDLAFFSGVLLLIAILLNQEMLASWQRIAGSLGAGLLCMPTLFFALKVTQDMGGIKFLLLIPACLV